MSSRILFFLEGEFVPASRFRVEQYLDELRSRGFDVVVCTTRPTKYLWYPDSIRRILPAKIVWAVISLIWITLQRVYQIVRYASGAKVVFIQRDLLYRIPIPFLEALLFWLSPASTRFVFDVDDAIFLNRNGEVSATLERKLRFVCRNCDLALVGNSYLERYFSRFTAALIIPTTVDVKRFAVKSVANDSSTSIPVIGWTGVRTNLSSLEMIAPALEALKKEISFKILVITDADAELPQSLENLDGERLPWTAATEIEDLHRIDIGVMPLVDDEWSKGKCGFKLLQYMATGIPCIASAVGVNQEIVKDGVNGYLARNLHEWTSAMRQLLQDAQLRARMGAEGRKTVEAGYSRDAWSKVFCAAVTGSRVDKT